MYSIQIYNIFENLNVVVALSRSMVITGRHTPYDRYEKCPTYYMVLFYLHRKIECNHHGVVIL